MRGEVIGINTAIASRTGQSAGIGFAVPIDLAKEILPQLKASGRVTRGQLGITIQSQWSNALAKEFGVDHGALVSDVTKGSPAEQAGLKQGDVIVEYNGKPLNEGNDLPRLVAATKPGTKVELKVVRDKKEKTFDVEVGTMKDTELAENGETQTEDSSVELGLSVMNLDADMAQQLDLDNDQGVVISRVKVGSPRKRQDCRKETWFSKSTANL